MALPTSLTANQILNRVAAEVGIAPVEDAFAVSDPTFVQMRYLLNTLGEELINTHQWESLYREAQLTTTEEANGVYPLPDDFAYIVNQTGWERGENVPLFGPLSAQDWQYLYGRDLVTYTIYASFRIAQGNFNIFPLTRIGLDIYYEYISNRWVEDGDNQSLKTEVSKTNDVPVYDGTLMVLGLKVKYLESHGLDSTKAQDGYNQHLLWLTGQNQGAEVLSAGRNRRGFPYLDSLRNTPDTGYGGTDSVF